MTSFRAEGQHAREEIDRNLDIQREQSKLWAQQCASIQSSLRARLEIVVREREPNLSDEAAILSAYYAYCLMTGDEESRLPDDGACAAEIQAAERLASEMMTERVELRELGVSSAHASALYWLSVGIDLNTLATLPDNLELAERYISFAIKWADAKATYLATASQINMTWRRFSRALDLAVLAATIEPTNAEAVRMKGMALFANGDLASAEISLEFARRLAPELEGIAEPLEAIKAELRK